MVVCLILTLLAFLPVTTSVEASPSASASAMLGPGAADDAGLLNLSDKDLLARGLAATAAHPDSALLYFSVITNRYKTQQPPADKAPTVVEAYRRMGNIYLLHFSDYEHAFTSLSEGRRMAEKFEVLDQLPSIYASMAALWQEDNLLFPKRESRVNEYLKKAYEVAARSGNEKSMALVMVNICLVAAHQDDISDFSHETADFQGRKFSLKSPYIQYVRYFMDGMADLQAKRYPQATSAFEKAAKIVEGDDLQIRLQLAVNSKLVAILKATGRRAESLPLLRQNLALARQSEVLDFIMPATQDMAEYFDWAGQPDSSRVYNMEYYAMRDTLYRDRVDTDVDFVANVANIDQDVQDLIAERQRRKQMLILISAIAAVAIIILVIVIWFYRTLRRNHKLLYLRHQELLDQDRELRAQREELAKLEAQPGAVHPDPETASPADSAGDAGTDTPSDTSEKRKYSDSPLDPETSEQLYKKILDTLQGSDKLYNPDFTVEELADMVGTRSRYVSQAINEHSGGNCVRLLSQLRIREACRRFADVGEYGSWTVEAVAQSVGFQSRTSFTKLFKQITGLTPSAYQRMARSGE